MTIGGNGEKELLSGAFDFIESSYLTYIIPQATHLDLEEASQDVEDTSSLFDTIEQRKSLFFDETVDVHLILKTPLIDETALRACLARLHISLEAHIASGHATDRDAPQQPDIFFQGVVEETDDPFIVVDASEDSDDGRNGDDNEQNQPHIYAVWKLPVFLSRPRARVQSPVISFKASASLKPADAATALGDRAGYLRSGSPAGLNLLESYGSDPSLNGIAPRLSALRVSRVAPVTQSQHMTKPIRTLPTLDLPVFPVIHTRVRFSRPNSAPVSAAIVALLEIDFTAHFDCEVTLDDIRLAVPDSTVEDLNEHSPGMALPITCRAHDHVTFLYRLAPVRAESAFASSSSKSPNSTDLDITIRATLHAVSGVCNPALSLAWATAVDFTIPVNPGFGPALQPIQRGRRPSQLSIGTPDGLSGATPIQSLTAPSVSRPDALPSLEAATARGAETSIPELGLTLTFCAPDGPVYPGEPFSWAIYVVNRTKDTSSSASSSGGNNSSNNNASGGAPSPSHRKLALFAIPKRRRNEVRVARPPSTAGKGKTPADGRATADAVLDENVIHAMQRSSLVDAADVVCLSADTRVGPLSPGACHVAELKFVALKPGIVGVEAIRVIDLGTQEHVDVRELPLMVVQERGGEDDE